MPSDGRGIFSAFVPIGLRDLTGKGIAATIHPTTPHSASASRARGPFAAVYHVTEASPNEEGGPSLVKREAAVRS